MRKRATITSAMLLLASAMCSAQTHTLAEANTIILILIFVVILLLTVGGVSLYFNHIIRQRNKKLRRILNGLEAYRKMMNEQIESSSTTPKKTESISAIDEGQQFFVKMDAKVSAEKPFINPKFDHLALIKFSGVPEKKFCSLMPRYSDPKNTMSYINSRRAEYGAQLILEQPELSIEEIAERCGFRKTAAFVVAFKFAFGITPWKYRDSTSQLLKKKV